MTWYSIGTVSVTGGSPVVSFAGAAMVANAQAGDGFIVPGSSVPPIEIAAINSDGQATLVRPWPGASGAGLVYTILPTQSYVHDLALQAAALLASFSSVRDGVGQGLFPDGTVAAPGFRFAADQDTGFYRKASNVAAIVAGGMAVAEFGSNSALFAEANGAIGCDVVARSSDNAGYCRIIDNGRSTVLSFWGFDPAVGLTLTASQGSARLAAAAGGAVYLRIGGADKLVLVGNQLQPGVDNSVNLGAAGLRFANIYCASGSINTSDERLKTWRGELTTSELAAAREIAASIGIFQYNEAIAEKGADQARLHTGVRAQQVTSIMSAHGLNPMRYAFVCYDEWSACPATPGCAAVPATSAVIDGDGRVVKPANPGRPEIAGTPAHAAGNLYAIRYDELAMFLAAAQEQRLAAIEAQLAA